MKIPIISTDVGIASNILSKNCIVNIEEEYYNPSMADVEYAYNNVLNLNVKSHGYNFIKLFSEI